MKKLLSIVLVFGLMFTAFPLTAFAKENVAETEIQTVKDNLVKTGEANPQETTYRDKLVSLLEYYCWDFDYTPEYWYEIYTKESYDNYLNAKTKAEKLLADENTTETEFQNMAEEFQTAKDSLVEVGEATQVANGTCGDNLKWSLDSNGTLSITGTGDMYFDDLAPWNYIKYRIKKVEISNGVTSIFASAFSLCESLASITIPDSVTSIGRDAFEFCTRLESINVDENNPNYSSIDGILFNKDKTEFIKYPAIKTDKSYTIPGSVTSIGEDAFYHCISLTSITIPDSVMSIGVFAFSYCESLTSINIPEKVTSIGNSAFWYCESLTSVTIPNSVTSIDECAFGACESLTSITIPDSVTSIGRTVFLGCSSLKNINVGENNPNYSSVDGVLFNKDKTEFITYPAGKTDESYTIPNSVTSISYSAFEDCTNLTSITIPNSVTCIDEYVFEYCTSLKSIKISDSVKSIGHSAFEGCKSLESVNLPNGITRIEYSVFKYCTSLKSITIPDSVASIDGFTFSGCTSLASVTIPEGVASIGSGIFRNCTNLASITIPESVTSIGYSAFEGCTSLTSITIPKGIANIERDTFRNSTSLTNVTISESVASIGNSAFYSCTSLSDIYYSGSKQMWNNISIGEGNEELTNANIHFGKESPKTTITLPKASAALFIGDRANINAVIINGFGATTYRSSNTKVAKVNSNGLVTAVGAGTAKITVTNNGVSKIFTVTVKKTTVSLARYSANIYVKGSTVIKPTVRNGRGKTTFKSLNTKVARVYSNGKVIALKAGTAKIRVTNNNVSRIFTVKVLNPKLNKTSVAISRGKSFTLKITGKIGTAKFYTSNKKIATVNSKGKITVNKKAKKGQSAVITVKTNGVTLRCKVKVK